MSDVVFSEPPTIRVPTGRESKYAPFFAAIKGRPGEWAEWPTAWEASHNGVHAIVKTAARRCGVFDDIEYTVRTDREANVKRAWVRWVGADA